ncbi:MAG TPA: pyridoxamine 5'-phosphate oxidase family protein [Flavobacteriales bacterium]
MSEHKELTGTKAVEQLKEIVDHQGVCLMITLPKDETPHSRPMAVAEVDDQGSFWFITLLQSDKCEHLQKDRKVHLHFANPKAQEYLSVYGKGEVVDDPARVKELWNPLAKAWVPEGSDDPNLRLFKVTPDESFYWDTKDGTVAAAVKILVAAMGLATKDGGVEGRIRV